MIAAPLVKMEQRYLNKAGNESSGGREQNEIRYAKSNVQFFPISKRLVFIDVLSRLLSVFLYRFRQLLMLLFSWHLLYFFMALLLYLCFFVLFNSLFFWHIFLLLFLLILVLFFWSLTHLLFWSFVLGINWFFLRVADRDLSSFFGSCASNRIGTNFLRINYLVSKFWLSYDWGFRIMNWGLLTILNFLMTGMLLLFLIVLFTFLFFSIMLSTFRLFLVAHCTFIVNVSCTDSVA
jgi:hypothetical protein